MLLVYGPTVKLKPYFQSGKHKQKIHHSDIGLLILKLFLLNHLKHSNPPLKADTNPY